MKIAKMGEEKRKTKYDFKKGVGKSNYFGQNINTPVLN